MPDPHRGGFAILALLAAVAVLMLFTMGAATCDQRLAEHRHWARTQPPPLHLAGGR